MIPQTVTIERQELHQAADTLSDAAILKLAPYAAFLRYEDKTPNADTVAALRDAENGHTYTALTRQEFFDAMHSDDDDENN
jgi:hypothetical protein